MIFDDTGNFLDEDDIDDLPRACRQTIFVNDFLSNDSSSSSSEQCEIAIVAKKSMANTL